MRITGTAVTAAWGITMLMGATGVGSGRLWAAVLAGTGAVSLWAIMRSAVYCLRTHVYAVDRGYEIATRALMDGLMDRQLDEHRVHLN